MAEVTVIPAIAHIAGVAVEVRSLSVNLAYMLTLVFGFVFMATSLQKCLSSDWAVVMLVCVQDTLKWLNWFREITLFMLQKGSMSKMMDRVIISW